MRKKLNKLQKLGQFLIKLWLFCILVFLLILLKATDNFTVTVLETEFGKSQLFEIFLPTTIIIGVFAFVLAICAFAMNLVIPEGKKDKLYVHLLRFLFLPFVLFYQKLELTKTIQDIKRTGSVRNINLGSVIKKVLLASLILLPLLGIWIGGYGVLAYLAGALPGTTSVTGVSMLPTYEEHDTANLFTYNSFVGLFRKIRKGDIVTFKSDKTIDKNGDLSVFIKRVVGTAGDKIETRDGFVYVNGQIIEEPYLNKPRSTFGGLFLQECKVVEVPKGYVFVLGDNRKRSQDSRNIGFIALSDISGTLPYSKQEKYKTKWHDASKDASLAGLVSFNKDEYYTLLNQKRMNETLRAVQPNTKLERAAKARADAIIQYNEVELKDSSKSIYPMSRALSDAGYYNTLYGEIVGFGYYDAQELLDYWLEFETKEYALNKEYQDTGITAVVGKINGCETQVIVQEFGAYIPPNYNQDLISGWENTLNRLREIYPSWENIKNFTATYNANKIEADRLLQILQIRISRINTIVTKMKANQWLTNEENSWTYEDKNLYSEQEELANKLNSIVWK